MSYYSLYRPQTIAQLDLQAVRTTLSQVLASGKFSHAYLFSGPKGTGKTSAARILAKVVNCEKNRKQLASQVVGQLVEPCNKCDSCKRITNGSSLACMEMDAASNRGIDDIRTLRERIGLSPAEGVMAVYIIDEVHMLTTEAFNALLKTLEEPPAHAMFILCTTDPEKIPDTVISRCTRVQFQKASVTEVMASLAKAVEGEGLTIGKTVLETIATRVDGSFRDGMKTLEQLAQAGAEIVAEMVDEATGHSEDYDPGPLVAALTTKDAAAALAQLAAKQTMGIDIAVYAKRLVESVRAQLLDSLKKQDKKLQLTMVDLAEQVEAAAVLVRRATMPILPLEIMAARWCLEGEVGEPPLRQGYAGQAVSQRVSESVSQRVSEPMVRQAVARQPVVSQPEVKQTIKLDPPKNAFVGSLGDISSRWQEVLLAVRPLNHSLEGILRSARPSQFEDGWLTIEAFYKFHKERLEQDSHRKLLEAAMGTLLGGAIQLRFVLSEKGKKVDNDDELVKAAEEVFL